MGGRPQDFKTLPLKPLTLDPCPLTIAAARSRLSFSGGDLREPLRAFRPDFTCHRGIIYCKMLIVKSLHTTYEYFTEEQNGFFFGSETERIGGSHPGHR